MCEMPQLRYKPDTATKNAQHVFVFENTVICPILKTNNNCNMNLTSFFNMQLINY